MGRFVCRIPMLGYLVLVALSVPLQPSAAADEAAAGEQFETDAAPEEPPRLPPPENAKPMPEPHRVWIDAQKKQVLVDGYVSLDEGLLEMFACTAGTKEHESIVAVYCSAQMVHAALLAVGAKVGHPVRWDPKFEPPTGTPIEIEVRWLDEQKQWQSARAQDWMLNVDTQKPMSHSWVFAGSGFWKDEETGKEYYMAEGGDLICVSNFSTATLDIPIESSQANEGLLFEANKQKVPEIGTPVRLVLKPKLTKDKDSKQKQKP